MIGTVRQQLDVLTELSVIDAAVDASQVRVAVAKLDVDAPEGTLVGLHPAWFRASRLAPFMQRGGKSGFVVDDMTDVDEFAPVGIELPDEPLYLVYDVRRGDEFQNASPEEVQPQLESAGRRPLTLHEGLSWAITDPAAIEANNCFMTIGSRKVKGRKRTGEVVYDARTPALWIASGTGRDGKERRNAPKLGWCWWRNRHTWLGIASAAK